MQKNGEILKDKPAATINDDAPWERDPIGANGDMIRMHVVNDDATRFILVPAHIDNHGDPVPENGYE